jgi:hypothetical protein
MLTYDILTFDKSKCESLYDNNGFWNFNNLDIHYNTDDDIYELLCLIHKINTIGVYSILYTYKYEYELMVRLKILYLIEYNNIYYYKEPFIIKYVNFQDIDYLIKYLYIEKLYIKDIKTYLLLKLKYNNIHHVRNSLKRRYIVKYNSTTLKLNDDTDYMTKYKTIKNHDNFNEFNKIFNNIVKDGDIIIKGLPTNPKYIKFAKSIKPKIKPFKLNYKMFIKKNKHIYTPGVKYEFEKFKKEVQMYYK